MPFLANKFTFKRCPARKMDSTSLIYRSHLSATEARKEFGLECTQVSLSLPSSSVSSSSFTSPHEEKWNKFVFHPATGSWFKEVQQVDLEGHTTSQEQEQQQQQHLQHHHHHPHHHLHPQEEHLIEFSETIDTSQLSQLNVKLADENRLLRLKIEILMDLLTQKLESAID